MAKIKQAIDEHRIDPRLADDRGPTKERLRHVRPSPINLALECDPPKLTRAQGLAAEKFYKHWHAGGMIERIPSIDLDRVFGGEGFSVMPRSDNEAFHRNRYRKAREMILEKNGMLAFWVLEQVVCHERPFTEVGAIFGHKNRTRAAQVAFDLLLPPLNLLCDEWGLA